MVVLTSTINTNGNMKDLERKIKCEKLMFRLFHIAIANADIGSMKCHL